MIRAAIIDDENKIRDNLIAIINMHIDDIDVIGTANNVERGVKLVKEKKPELIFLDVELSDGTGFDLLARIEHLDSPVKVIFTTGFNRDAVEIFRVNALEYLAKPINPKELIDSVNRIRDQLLLEKDPNQKQRFDWTFGDLKYEIPAKGTIQYVAIKDIIYCKSWLGKTKIILEGKKNIISNLSLDMIEEKLLNISFLRVHKSFFINLKKVKNIESNGNTYLYLSDDTRVPVTIYNEEELQDLLKLFR